jgi:hypothetical protein
MNHFIEIINILLIIFSVIVFYFFIYLQVHFQIFHDLTAVFEILHYNILDFLLNYHYTLFQYEYFLQNFIFKGFTKTSYLIIIIFTLIIVVIINFKLILVLQFLII